MRNGYSFLNDEDLSIFNHLYDPISEVAKVPPLLLEEFNPSMSSGSKKRNRDLDPGNSQEANGKVRKKQLRCPGTIYTGESSTSRQQERLKGKTVAGMAKVYKDRISRRIKNDIDNLLNDGMPPAINRIYQEEEIPNPCLDDEHC
ncbi:hypothetical protein ES319_D11G380400v1 [Gossypium barbadense]|uniref:Uncharacterized protein n=3 Tax=Gossypium TaxID=3633 RepID=A0A5J5PJB4_GOSBA|nr:hypothetical protein ES319_D11G380400v1 [Gossypium barbadense]TYG48152.1 hypothetical protein ES288_D11G400700v1 [Gossypium darwinii]TYH47351.1 hypothetical protein ES332_D11G405600v1 [Gossypium tomentosum]